MVCPNQYVRMSQLTFSVIDTNLILLMTVYYQLVFSQYLFVDGNIFLIINLSKVMLSKGLKPPVGSINKRVDFTAVK